MVQFGKVVATGADTAVVEIIRESACSGCHNKDSCTAGVISGCGKAERVEVSANNLCNAVPGDRVELTSASGKTIGIAFCVFVLPLLIGFGAYFIFENIFPDAVLPYVISVAAFLLSFFMLFFGIDRVLSKKINVDITRVIEFCGNEQENID